MKAKLTENEAMALRALAYQQYTEEVIRAGQEHDAVGVASAYYKYIETMEMIAHPADRAGAETEAT